MLRLDLHSFCSLLALAACSPADGGSASGTGSSGTTSTGGTSGTSSGTLVTTGAPSTGTGGGTDSGGTGGTSGGTSGATSGTTSSGSSSAGASTGDTGGVGACEPALGDYGDCATPLGFAFDGAECTARSGCDCAPDCDKFFAEASACALTCAAAGHCNADRIQAAGIAMKPVQQGSFCDELDVCLAEPALHATFEQIFGMLTCENAGFPCEQGQICHGLWQGELGPDAWLRACAASLVEGGGLLHCVVFGP